MTDQNAPQEDPSVQLLNDYREIVRVFCRAAKQGRPAHSALADLHCFWPRQRLFRVASDLPDEAAKVFLKL